ncbi:MAG: DUF4013 domain-containing protein [Chloroflexota bacterium]
MLANFDINHLLAFPVKDRDAVNKSLVGFVVTLLAFVIPILPMLILAGYTARIARQVLDGQKPSMPAWDDWGTMIKDGARIFAVRMIYASPLLLILIVVFGLMAFLPVFAETSGDPDSTGIFIFFPLLVFGSMIVTVPFSFFLGIVLPAAEVHVIAQNEFAAGFRFREWWAVFRKNWGGFLLAFALSYAISILLVMGTQLLMITIILACLVPLLMPAVAFYMSVVMYAAFARAYKDGREMPLQEPTRQD